MEATAYIQVFTTVGTQAAARQLAQTLVEKKVAGCVQVLGPIASTYWWQGEIESAEEWLCILKSRRDRYTELEAAIRAVHPYQVPEILAMPVVEGHQPYMEWLEDALTWSPAPPK
jgi:periplasmic divalent cation tolerance protein